MVPNPLIIARVSILVVALILCVAGTAAQQMTYSNSFGKIFLYGTKTQFSNNVVKFSQTGCQTLASKMNAAFAFAIIGCIAIFIALIVAILLMVNVCGRWAKMVNMSSFWLSVSAVFATAIPWAIVAAVFDTRQCNSYSVKSLGGRLDAGFGLLVATSLLLMADGLLSLCSIWRQSTLTAAQSPLMGSQQSYAPYTYHSQGVVPQQGMVYFQHPQQAHQQGSQGNQNLYQPQTSLHQNLYAPVQAPGATPAGYQNGPYQQPPSQQHTYAYIPHQETNGHTYNGPVGPQPGKY